MDQSNVSILDQTELAIFKASSIHRYGGFARIDIAEGTRIIEYVGERISKQESQRRCQLNNEYIFDFDEDTDLDGNTGANLARFINHSCSPNCEAVLDEGAIWITALRDIPAGEELTFNYGYDLEDYKEHPCACGAPNCVGYIIAEELFEELLKREKEAGSQVNQALNPC